MSSFTYKVVVEIVVVGLGLGGAAELGRKERALFASILSRDRLQPVTIHLQRFRGIGNGALLRTFFCGDPKDTRNGDFVYFVRLGVDWDARDEVGGVVWWGGLKNCIGVAAGG